MFGVKAALGAAVVVAGVGVIAAALDGNWDLVFVIGFVLLCQAGIALALLGPRRLTTLRPDLARWADERAAITGEPVPRIVDRCVAAYRDQLFAPDD